MADDNRYDPRRTGSRDYEQILDMVHADLYFVWLDRFENKATDIERLARYDKIAENLRLPFLRGDL